MIMRIIRVIFSVTILFLLAIACQTTPDNVVHALLQAENCMESQPDSALALLQRIPHPEDLRSKAQADYALLMTQAMDKNYMKPTSDSLILLAVSYYGSHEANSLAKGKAYFYYGRVMQELKRDEDAMKYYLSAKKVLDGSKEYKLLGQISEEIGNLNWNRDMYTEALNNYQNAKTYYAIAKDSLGISYSLRNIGRIYISIGGKSDSAYMYYQDALQIAQINKCGSEFTILQELGLVYRVKKEYEKAEYYLLQSLHLYEEAKFFTEIYLSLGYTYLQMNNIKEADKYLKMSIQSSNVFTRIDAYNTLFKLEKLRGNLCSAIEYKEKSDSLNIIAKNSEIREIVANLQKKYENEKLQKENLQIRIGYKNVLIFCLILFFAIILLVCYYTYRNHSAKRKMREIEQKIADNKEEIAFCQQDISDYKKLQSESEEHKIELVTEIAKLDGKVSVLSKYNQELTKRLQNMGGEQQIQVLDPKIESVYIAAFRIYFAIRNGLTNIEISTKDWERIFMLFDLLYLNFVKRLKEEFPQLTKHDLEICCLVKIGLSNEELSRIFLTASDSATKAKGRLKKRLNLSPEDDLERFICTR